MTDILKLVAQYTSQILNQTPGDVVNIGRENVKRNDFNALQIIIDELAPQQLISIDSEFDYENELMRFYSFFESDLTIDFFGDDATTEAYKFINLQQSQFAIDTLRALNLTLYYTQSITNVKLLTGEQFSNRLQIALRARYVATFEQFTRAIETLQLDLIEDA